MKYGEEFKQSINQSINQSIYYQLCTVTLTTVN